MYKDKDKQREANRQIKAKQRLKIKIADYILGEGVTKGVTSQNVTKDVTNEAPACLVKDKRGFISSKVPSESKPK